MVRGGKVEKGSSQDGKIRGGSQRRISGTVVGEANEGAGTVFRKISPGHASVVVSCKYFTKSRSLPPFAFPFSPIRPPAAVSLKKKTLPLRVAFQLDVY